MCSDNWQRGSQNILMECLLGGRTWIPFDDARRSCSKAFHPISVLFTRLYHFTGLCYRPGMVECILCEGTEDAMGGGQEFGSPRGFQRRREEHPGAALTPNRIFLII